jgi:hypothetical protein
MLVTLKLFLADGRERQISYEVHEQDGSDARELLQRMSEDGKIRLGDREAYPLAAVRRVELVPEEIAAAPEWLEDGTPPEARLRDEDVSSALRQQHPSERPDAEAAD